jgi:hypothetical protein
MCGVDHDALGFRPFAGKCREDPVADDVDNPADHPAIIDTRPPMRAREACRDTFELGFADPVLI